MKGGEGNTGWGMRQETPSKHPRGALIFVYKTAYPCINLVPLKKPTKAKLVRSKHSFPSPCFLHHLSSIIPLFVCGGSS